MTIHACPKCGSKNIQMGTMGAGVTYGITSWKSVCRDCGYQGEPLIFDSESDYNKFLTGFSGVKASDQTQELNPEAQTNGEDEDISLSPKEKEMLEFLDEIKDVDSQEKVEPRKEKNWWPEIILASILSAVTVITGFQGILSVSDVYTTFLYLFLGFIAFAVIILFVFVIIEYFYNLLKRSFEKKNK